MMRLISLLLTLCLVIIFLVPGVRQWLSSFDQLTNIMPFLQQPADAMERPFEQDWQSESRVNPTLNNPRAEAVTRSKQVYQWQDENGQLQFTEVPPPEGVEFTKRTVVSTDPALDAEAYQATKTKPRVVKKRRATRGKGKTSNSSCARLERQIQSSNQKLKKLSRSRRFDSEKEKLKQLRYRKMRECP